MDDNRASGAHAQDHPLYAPGLKRRKRAGSGTEARYWIPSERFVKAGWSLKIVPFPAHLTEEDVAVQCQGLWKQLKDWRQGQPTKTRYSISWLIHHYQSDERSPYRAVREKTQRGYNQSLRIIDETVGTYLIDAYPEGGIMRPRLFGKDLREWHYNWGQPDRKGNPTTPVRAWHAMTMLRILFSYAVELGVPGGENLRELAGLIRVTGAQPSESAPTHEMVLAHVAKAAEKGLLSMAIATLGQFEFTERRTHVIGTWERGQWGRGWRWQGIRDWFIEYEQNKVGKVERRYDLRSTPALLDLLQRIPEEKRVGPVIICERTGNPWKERHFIKTFRQIADEIGLPASFCSKDMRAGGATEAGAILGITLDDLQAAGGWKDPAMARRYDKGSKARAQKVVNIRQASRRTSGE